jgi:hypothetical protein
MNTCIEDQIRFSLINVPKDALLGCEGYYTDYKECKTKKYKVLHVGYVSSANSDFNALYVNYLHINKDGEDIPLVIEPDQNRREHAREDMLKMMQKSKEKNK